MAERKGIILAGGTGSRLSPMTRVVSKHLLPVYNKPMIYYPITLLKLAGIDDILIITNPDDSKMFKELLGDGAQWGLRLSFETQASPKGIPEALLISESFLSGSNSLLVLGDTLLFGNGVGRNLKSIGKDSGAQVMGVEVSNPAEFGIAELDREGRVLSLAEKPTSPKSNIAIPGVYFFDHLASSLANELEPSGRGELEIVDLLRKYLDVGELSLEMMGRGTVWRDLGTVDSLADASALIRLLENQHGFSIGDPSVSGKTERI